MALIIDKVRRLEKSSSIASELPTIAPNNDHTTGWSATDIYERELFANLPDGKLYTREGTEIIEFGKSDGVLSDTSVIVTNGSTPLVFDVSGFDFIINGRSFTHSATADEVTITNGDVTNPRYDIIVIDNTNIASVVAGTPSATPVIPTLPSNKVLLGVIFVPTNHTVASAAIEPIQRDIFSNTQSTVIRDWNVGQTLIKGMYVNKDDVLYRVSASHISSDFVDDLQTNSNLAEIGSREGEEEEWQSSVVSTETDPSSLTPSVGDRYLIGGSAIGIWASRDGQIAEWRGSKYRYTTPSDGMTVKDDSDDTAIYHHEGSYVSGVFAWVAQSFGGGGGNGIYGGSGSLTADTTVTNAGFDLSIVGAGTFEVAAATLSIDGNTNVWSLGYLATPDTVSSSAVTIGYQANTVGGGNSIAIGAFSRAIAAGSTSNIAIGYQARADNGTEITSIGNLAGNTITTFNTKGILIGYNAGSGSTTLGTETIAIGQATDGSGIQSVAVGSGAETSGHLAIAIGRAAVGSGRNSIALGQRATATADGAYIISGGDAVATNSQTDSLALAWDDATIRYLFSKTADSYLNGLGNLAIGHTTPTEKVHLIGNMLIDGEEKLTGDLKYMSTAALEADVIKIVQSLGSITFDGTTGGLFSITDDKSGQLFGVADVSGNDIMYADADWLIQMGNPFQTGGVPLELDYNSTTGDTQMNLNSNTYNIGNLVDYADDTAAGVGGLVTGDLYRVTATKAIAVKD